MKKDDRRHDDAGVDPEAVAVEMTDDTKHEWGLWKILKSFLNAIFHSTSNLDNDPFWNPPNTDKYKLVSRDERSATLETLQCKYPNFRSVYQLHKWIELWNTMRIPDEIYRDAFLRHFESAIKEFDEKRDVE